MNKLFIILVGMTFSACSAQIKFTGSYVHTVPNWVNSEMTIRSNSSYVYTYQSGLEETEVKGKWEKNGNVLTFNSYKQSPKDSLLVKELETRNPDSIKFRLTNFENEPIQFAAIANLQDTSQIIGVNENGIGFMQNNYNMKEFIIFYIGHQYVYRVKAPSSNYFDIKAFYLNPKDTYYRFFINEQWQLKRNKLIDTSSKRKIKYKKEPGE